MIFFNKNQEPDDVLCQRSWQTQTHQHFSTFLNRKPKQPFETFFVLSQNPDRKTRIKEPWLSMLTCCTFLLSLMLVAQTENQSSVPIRKRSPRNFLSFVGHQETWKQNRFLLWWTLNKRTFNKSILDSRSSRPSSWYQLLIFYVQQPGTYVAEYSNFEEE